MISTVVSYIDAKKSVIPDKIILPAIFVLGAIKALENSLSAYDMLAVLIVLVIFIVPVFLNMEFGGGDLRFGAFCALFLGLPLIGWFVLLSGLLQVALLVLLRKKSFGFAPAMSAAALASYLIGQL